ncbi:MAG: hypothetical protein HY277_09875, partial [Ignavibacteriales bacterium]|nr:hypothetical protein [Ignavibacteriales bacterium]
MKYLAFALVISSLILSSSEAQEEGHEKPYLDFWNNWLTPQQYAEQLNYVQNVMKDESEAEGTFKGKRREIFEAQKWKCVGPNVVRVLNGDRSVNSDIVFHGRVRALKWYNDPSLGWELYLAASSGGLWIGHTTIFVGRIWNSLGDNLPNQSVGAFDIKPGDPKTIFVGTGDFQRFTGAGLYKTTNRGLSWTKVPLRFASGALIYNDPDSFTDLFYDPTDASIMWLSSTFGVFKSTDGGITWLQVPVDTTAPNQTVHDLVIDPSDHNRLYAAFGFPGPARLIWRTSNGGTNWQRADAGLPTTNLGRTIALDISSSNPLVLYAAVSDAKLQLRGIYKTTDRGTTWNPTSSQPYDYMGGQAHDKNVIRVHPTDANIVYAGSIGFIKSTDGGASWTVPNRGHDDQTVIDFDPIDLSKMYVAGDGGVFRYDDAANAVRNVDEIFAPGSIIQSYSLDYAASKTTVMIGGTQDNGTLVTEQGGTESASWTMFSGCDGGNHVSISPATSAEFFFNSWCGKHHPRLRSLDRGATVDDINSGLIDTNLYYTPISLGKKVVNLLFTVSPTTLYYSTDKGNNWL